MTIKNNDNRNLLLESGIITLFTEVDSASAAEIIMQLQIMNAQNPNMPVQLLINSPGGSVSDAFAIIDTIDFIKNKVIGIGMGMVASSAALILSSCSKGNRMLLPNAEVLIHQPLAGIEFTQATNVVIRAQHLSKVKDKINRLLARNCNQPYEKILADTDRDYIMTAPEALEYGIIDRIIETAPKALQM